MNYLSSRTKKIILISLLSIASTAIIILVFFSIDFSKAATEGRNISGRAQIVNTGNFIHFNSEVNGADVQIGSPNGSGDRYLTGNAYSEDSGLISFSSMSSSISTDFQGYYPKFDREVNVIKEQADGKLIVGGDFSTFDNIPINKIARLNADGTLDESFDSGNSFSSTAGQPINDIVIQPDGKIVVVGNFAVLVNSVYSYDIVRLNSNGSLDTTFNTGTGLKGTGTILGWSVDLQSDGKIIVGGNFSKYNEASVNRFIRLNTNGTKDSTFNMTYIFSSDIYDVKVLSTGKILVGSGLNGNLSRFNTDGSRDSSFSPGFSYQVRDIEELPDGKIMVAGGTVAKKIVRLNPDGTWDTSFNSGTSANTLIYDIEPLDDGSMLIGGAFISYNGVPTSKIAHIFSDGSLDTDYQAYSYFDSDVNSILVSGSSTYIGGNFSMTSDVNSYFTRLTSTGSVDSNFHQEMVGFDNAVYDAADYNGRLLVGGSFTSYNGEAANKVAILNADGTKYDSFDPGDSASGTIYAVAMQSDGKVLVGGGFSTFQGNSSIGIARMNTDGSYDSSFNVGSGISGGPSVIRVQDDGKILVGGSFTSVDGTTMNRLARLNSNGSIDSTFNIGTGFDNTVMDIEILESGDIVVVGRFSTYQGSAKSGIVKLNNDGTVDTSFVVTTGFAGTSLFMRAVTELSNGGLLVGGNFDSFNGNSIRHDMIRFYADGSMDLHFSLPNEMTNNGQYYDMVELSTGEFLVVGSFTGVGGCSYAMKLSSTGSSATCLGNPNSVAIRGLETSNGIYVAGSFTALGSTVHKYLYEYGKYSTAYVDGDTGKLTGTGNILSGGTIDFNHANSNVFMDSTGLFTGDAYSSTIGMIDFDYEPVRILDLTGPSGSITINSGDINTTTRDVVLTMTSSDAVSGVNNMIICEDNTFTGCSWENYSSTKEITLSEAEGNKNIYMKLIDNAGNESEIFTDAIFLDSLPPSLPTELTVSPDEYSSTDEFDFSWTASVDSGIGDVIYEYRTGTNAGIYSTWQTTTDITLDNIPSYLSGENTFYLRAKDSLENTSEQVEVKYYYDGESPTAPTNLVVTSPALSTVNSFSFSWGASSDIGIGEVTYQYRLANTQTWKTVVGTTVSNIQAYMVGNNVFYVRSIDSVGNISQEASITFAFNPVVEQEDITPPVVEDTTPDPTPVEEETGSGDAVVEEEPEVETPVVQEPVVEPETTTGQPRVVTQEDSVVIDGETVSVGDLFSESEEFIELPEGVDPITVEDGIEIGATITGDDETVQVNTVVKGNTVYVKDIEELTISVPVASVVSKTADTDIKGVTVEFGEITAQAVMNESKTHYVADIEFGEIKSTNTVLAKVITDYENGERLIKGMNFVLQARALQTVAMDMDWVYGGVGFLLIIVLGYVTYKADKKTYLKESL